MTWPELAAETADAVFAEFGIVARYRVGGAGDGVDVTVVERLADETLSPDFARLRVEGQAYEVRVSEVASPSAGDSLTFADSSVRVVQGAPERNEDRTVWLLDTRPA